MDTKERDICEPHRQKSQTLTIHRIRPQLGLPDAPHFFGKYCVLTDNSQAPSLSKGEGAFFMRFMPISPENLFSALSQKSKKNAQNEINVLIMEVL